MLLTKLHGVLIFLVLISAISIANAAGSEAKPVHGGSRGLTTPEVTSSSESKDSRIAGLLSPQEKKDQFNQAVDAHWPMSNKQIQDFKAIVSKHSKAVYNKNIKINKNPITRNIDSLGVIDVSPGYITTINFSDHMGNSWPIQYIMSSNGKIVTVGQADKNTIIATAASFAGEVNVIVKLKGVDMPIHLSLKVNQDVVDYMIVGMIDGVSPNAKPDVVIPKQPAPGIRVNAIIMESFLNQVPPGNSIKLKVDREGVLAWLYKRKMYMRTKYTLASPGTAHDGVITDGRGNYLYRIDKFFRKPIFLIDGQFFFVNISGGDKQ